METKDRVFDGVKDVLCDSLGVGVDEVVSEASLARDLGAESIDFLDIIFRLEKKFNIKIPRGDIFPNLGDLLTDDCYNKDKGEINEKGYWVLIRYLPEIPEDKLRKIKRVEDIGSLVNVDYIVDYIVGKVEGIVKES